MPGLRFNRKIYSWGAVVRAVSAYSELAKFTIRRSKDYIEVKIAKGSPRENNLSLDEFANYVLGMTKK